MKRKLISAVAFVATGVVAFAPSAQAASYVVYNSGAYATFESTGEVLSIRDTAKDGHHVEARFTTSNNSTERALRNYDGFNTSKSIDLDIPETGWIRVRACTYEGNNAVACTTDTTFSAKG